MYAITFLHTFGSRRLRFLILSTGVRQIKALGAEGVRHQTIEVLLGCKEVVHLLANKSQRQMYPVPKGDVSCFQW